MHGLQRGRRRVERAVRRAQPAVLHVDLLAVRPQFGERHLDVGVGRRRSQPEVDAAGSRRQRGLRDRRAVERERLAERQRAPVEVRVRGPDARLAAAVVGRRLRGRVVDVGGRRLAVGVRDRRRARAKLLVGLEVPRTSAPRSAVATTGSSPRSARTARRGCSDRRAPFSSRTRTGCSASYFASCDE